MLASKSFLQKIEIRSLFEPEGPLSLFSLFVFLYSGCMFPELPGWYSELPAM